MRKIAIARWWKDPRALTRGLDAGRPKGPIQRRALKRAQLILVERLIRDQIRANKANWSNPRLAKHFYPDYKKNIEFENRAGNQRRLLKLASEATFLDYVKDVAAFYRAKVKSAARRR
jgi:hypothetical protein